MNMNNGSTKHHPGHISNQHDTAVLVGWEHASFGSNIELRVQSARSRFALENGEYETRGVMMTRNQALLLAKYLLDATGQTLPEPVKPSIWRKVANGMR
jgi:hypothetical protein